MQDATAREFSDFVSARYPSLVRTGYLLVGDRGHAEDLVQSALVRCYAAWSKLAGPPVAEAYTRTTMIRLAQRWASADARWGRSNLVPAGHRPCSGRTDCWLATMLRKAPAMDETGLIKVALTAHADRITPVGVAPLGELISRGRRRRLRHRVGVRASVAVCAILAIGLPLLVIVGVNRDRAAGPVVRQPVVDQAAVLAKGHWSYLPAAPIAGRNGAVSAWTGNEMLIWGGATVANPPVGKTDGAAYDPTTRSWQVLPRSPLSARLNTASVWTGKQLFIWGGFNVRLGPCPLAGCSGFTDGALYDPDTHTWTTVAKSSIGGYTWAQAFWLNGRVILLSKPRQQTVTMIDAHAYDPSTSKWLTLASLHVPADRPIQGVVAAAASNNVVVWSEWELDHVNGGGQEASYDNYIFNPGADRWAAIPRTPGVGQPVSTGTGVAVASASRYCGNLDCPAPTAEPGYLLTSSGRLGRKVPLGPISDGDASYVWVGNGLVGYDLKDSVSGPNISEGPGDVALWSAASNKWIRLPSQPLVGDLSTAAVWDGHELLMWGSFTTLELVGHEGADRTAGLMFGG